MNKTNILEAKKKEQIASMFDKISRKYDFLNHFLSLNIDKSWRKSVIKILKKYPASFILDLATGTGDLAIAQAQRLKVEKIIGIDISSGMLEIGKKKVKKLNLESCIELKKGDALNLKFDNDTFDVVSVAYGVRNFEILEKGLKEIYRVLKPNGITSILEFSKPENYFVKNIYKFYFLSVLPFLGRIFSRSNNAYRYLPQSVYSFPSGKEFLEIMEKVGFENNYCKKLTFGVSSIYVGVKK